MSSLVLELQQEAYDSNKSISDLLRKAYIVAKKLKILEFQEWLNAELNGYTKNESIPKYRIVSGEVRALNEFRGWIPVIIDNTELYNALIHKVIPDSIVSLETLIKSGDDNLAIKFDNDVRKSISKLGLYDTDFQLVFHKTKVEAIIEYVRNIVLEWSLKLEEDGIVGEGMSFSDKEKDKANEKGYRINNFYGNITNSQIQQDTVNSTQNMSNETIDTDKILEIINLIRNNIDKMSLDEEKKIKIDSNVKTIQSELDSPKPQSKIIKESFSIIKGILEKVTANIIASGVLLHVGNFLK